MPAALNADISRRTPVTHVHFRPRHAPLPLRYSLTTAGSRPPLLGERAFVHRKNRFFAGKRSRSNKGAGGVSPPWEPCTRGQRLKITQSRRWYKSRTFAAPLDATAPAFVGTLPAVSRDFAEAPLQVRYPRPRRADARRSWLCVRSSLNNIRFSRHSDRMTEPRRAHARRSCERAFVHRKSRFFAARRPHRNTRAGGVSPPWYVFGMRTRLRQSGALPLQTRFATPLVFCTRRVSANDSGRDVGSGYRRRIGSQLTGGRGRFRRPGW